jgi:hypothetical protein
MSRFGLDHSYIEVSRHNPADFLVSILEQDAFGEIANREFLLWWPQVPA